MMKYRLAIYIFLISLFFLPNNTLCKSKGVKELYEMIKEKGVKLSDEDQKFLEDAVRREEEIKKKAKRKMERGTRGTNQECR